MATSAIPATRLKKGDLILLEGQCDEIFKIKNTSTSAPGKHGHAKVRIMYENIFTGSGGEVTYSGHKEIEKPVVEKEKSQVLSITAKVVPNDPKLATTPAVAQLMNLETFETYDLQVPLDMDETQLQSGIEVEVRVYGAKRWIERITPTG
jgi:translation initiation factor 5A